MLKWLERKVQNKAIAEARTDIERFVSSLKGLPNDAIGSLVAFAAVMKINLTQQGALPLGILESETYHRTGKAPKAAMHLRKLIAGFQKDGQQQIAAAMMVWLHSLRAIFIPEITYIGQEMWSELRRGFPYAEESLENLQIVMGITVPDGAQDVLGFVPPILAEQYSS